MLVDTIVVQLYLILGRASEVHCTEEGKSALAIARSLQPCAGQPIPFGRVKAGKTGLQLMMFQFKCFVNLFLRPT